MPHGLYVRVRIQLDSEHLSTGSCCQIIRVAVTEPKLNYYNKGTLSFTPNNSI